MNKQHHNDTALRQEDRALWQAARSSFTAPQGAEPEPLLLAAYLDGRLDEAERDRVEALLAASPRALEVFLAADAALGATQAAPERLLARAAGLVPGEASEPSRGGWLRRLFAPAPAGGAFRLQPLTLALTLVAVLAVSAAGFEIGRFGYAVAAEEGLVGATTAMAELDGLGLASDASY